MSINPYLNIETSSDFQVYEFESTGKKSIKKRVRFDLIDDMSVFIISRYAPFLLMEAKTAKQLPVTAIWKWYLKLRFISPSFIPTVSQIEKYFSGAAMRFVQENIKLV